MEIAEIRDLDGPNLFLLKPAIKLQLDFSAGDPVVAQNAFELASGGAAEPELETTDQARVLTLVSEVINLLHNRTGESRPELVMPAFEEPGHAVIAFSWTHRRFAKTVAKLAVRTVLGEPVINDDIEHLGELRGDTSAADRPEMYADADRHIPIIAVTGTNGKTTTTRLISAILMHSGKRTAWTSSSGVLVQGEYVLHGDYTGPAGAARVFEEAELDVAVLETARGGILLRGVGFESNDVSVVTNISPDHLGLQGVHTVEGLAEVKSTVPKVTREDGFAVLNAEQPLVLAMRSGIKARPFLVSRQAHQPEVMAHIDEGGWALTVRESQVHWHHDHESSVLTDLNDIPISFGGRALHMLENALCAAAACLAIGLSADQVRSGLASFRNQSDQNRGRLNVYDLNGVTVIVDFAHNGEGLKHLLSFAQQMREGSGSIISVIGTAGDRRDEDFVQLAEMAVASSDQIVLKDSDRYLRGREPGEMLALMLPVVEPSGKPFETSPAEVPAFHRAIELAKPGDVVAMMCVEDYDAIIPELESTAKSLS